MLSNSHNIEYFVVRKRHYEETLKKYEYALSLKYIWEKQSDNQKAKSGKGKIIWFSSLFSCTASNNVARIF